MIHIHIPTFMWKSVTLVPFQFPVIFIQDKDLYVLCPLITVQYMRPPKAMLNTVVLALKLPH